MKNAHHKHCLGVLTFSAHFTLLFFASQSKSQSFSNYTKTFSSDLLNSID